MAVKDRCPKWEKRKAPAKGVRRGIGRRGKGNKQDAHKLGAKS
jgi:hypothetical protein